MWLTCEDIWYMYSLYFHEICWFGGSIICAAHANLEKIVIYELFHFFILWFQFIMCWSGKVASCENVLRSITIVVVAGCGSCCAVAAAAVTFLQFLHEFHDVFLQFGELFVKKFFDISLRERLLVTGAFWWTGTGIRSYWDQSASPASCSVFPGLSVFVVRDFCMVLLLVFTIRHCGCGCVCYPTWWVMHRL